MVRIFASFVELWVGSVAYLILDIVKKPSIFCSSITTKISMTLGALWRVSFLYINVVMLNILVFGFSLNNFGFCVGMIPIFGLVFRILTLIMLYQLPDDSPFNIATIYLKYYLQWENIKKIPRKIINYVNRNK